MKSLLILIVLASGSVQASEPLSSVMNYLAPIRPGEVRPGHWPVRLTFFSPREPLSIEAVAGMVKGTWTYVYHCGGKALPLGLLIDLAPADGWVDPAIVLHLADDRFYFSKVMPNSTSEFGAPNSTDNHRYDPIRGSYVVSPSENEGEYRVHFYTMKLRPAYVRPLLVGDTGEVVLELRDNTLPACPTGEPLRIIMVPVPMS